MWSRRLTALVRVFWPRVDKAAERSEDWFVQLVDWALGWFQTFLNVPLYSAQAAFAKWLNRGKPWLYFNYIYFVEWAVIFGVLLAKAEGASGRPQLVLVSVALWRGAEILAWYTKLLFDKGHRVFVEVERNLLFLIGDSLVFVTTLALMLETAKPDHLAARWSDAFSAFTLNGSPDDYDKSGWATATGILGAVGGIALLAAGLGIIIGIISDRIRTAHLESERPPQRAPLSSGRYTGPTRPAPPWAERAQTDAIDSR